MGESTGKSKELSPLRRALIAVKDMRARMEASERARTAPIAIVGMACRFPGGACDLDAYWRLLRDGVDAIAEIPRDRWDIETLYSADPEAPGKMYTREGGFLEGVDTFDAGFFGIAPREVVGMDPQQRLLLEVSWESLECAGIPPTSLAGSTTAVFVGIGPIDYSQLQVKRNDLERIDPYTGTGGVASVAAGRLSYVLGLHGPAVALDTACSSSLVAVDLAVQSLRAGSCDLALAGGASLMLSPEATVYLCKVRALSPDGRCKTFDASADGYGRGEGCGMVVLKRLIDAEADGDEILAVIRGSAVNHDGSSSGLTVPNGMAQQAVIRAALANGGIVSEEVGYIEAHGTGTELGDPIELRALDAVFRGGRSREQPLVVGSAKTNIGHLEASAGVAGLIKLVLCLAHEEIPPHLYLENPTPHVDWDKIRLAIPSERVPWPRGERRRIGGISSFGFSGTNAHVLVEEAPAVRERSAATDRPLHLLAISAKTDQALRDLAARYETHLAGTAAPLGDVCFTAGAGRSHFENRLALVGESAEAMRAGLAAFARSERVPGLQCGQAGDETSSGVAFLFTGQGSQYVGMGRQLYQTQPTFRLALDRCDELLRPHLERPLLAVLYPGDEAGAELLDQTAYTQPALFALEYALAEVLRSWGIEPAAVLGHSIGEYVGACVAGVFSLEDGLRLVAERARLMQSLPTGGSMAAVLAGEERVVQAIAPFRDVLSVAAVNGPENTVISGAAEAVRHVTARLEAEGVKSRRLTVSHAFHSPLMEPVLDALERAASRIRMAEPRVELVSNLTGDLVREGDLTDARYWRRHASEAVRFSAGMQTLAARGCETFVEVGPSPTLLGMGRRCLPESEGAWLPSLRKGREDWSQLLDTVGSLYVRGVPVDWNGFDRDCARRKVFLPTYPFQRRRYWLQDLGEQPRRAASGPGPVRSEALHPLLGRRVESPIIQHSVFEAELSLETIPFVGDYRILGTPVLPATALLEMVLAAAEEVLGAIPETIREIEILQPLLLPEHESREVQVILSSGSGGVADFQIVSRAVDPETGAGAWTVHASGEVCAGSARVGEPRPQDRLEDLLARCSEQLDVRGFYERFVAVGLEHGPIFRGVERVWRGESESVGQLRLDDPTAARAAGFHVHPALLDHCFQLLAAALPEAEAGVPGELHLPVRIGRFRFAGRSAVRAWGHARVRSAAAVDPDTLTADLRLMDADGQTIAEVEGLELRRASRETLVRATGRARFSRTPSAAGSNVRSRLDDAAEGERLAVMVAYLQEAFRRVLGLDTGEAPGIGRPLGELGLDSLMAIELRNLIQNDLRLSVSASEFLDAPSISELGASLLCRSDGRGPASHAASPTTEDSSADGKDVEIETPSKILAHVDRLSDDAVDALLRTMLAEDEVGE